MIEKPSQCKGYRDFEDGFRVYVSPESHHMRFFAIDTVGRDIGGAETSYRHHFCGHDDARKIGRMIDAVYTMAAELISAWDSELAS